MTDIFFSYSSKDRERVRPVRDALAAQGFEVFWDQEVPTGLDWDRWIRDHLNKAKCALVFWSINSIASDNVRHEATVAKQHGKLVPVMLDALTAEQFPMGLYAVQGANLAAWAGDAADVSWLNLQREIESKLTPLWMRRSVDGLEAELLAERARREAAERRDRTLRDQIVKEAQAQQELRRERDHALDEVAELKARLEQKGADGEAHKETQRQRDQALQELADLKTQQASLSQQLAAARDKARALESDNDTLADELQKNIKTLEALQLASFAKHFDATLEGGAPAFLSTAKRGAAASVENRTPPAATAWKEIAIALAFAIAVPFVVIGFMMAFESWGWTFALYQAAPSGALMGAMLMLAIGIARVVWRRATLGGLEIALYWLGCAPAFVFASMAVFSLMGWTAASYGRAAQTGFVIGGMCALLSAAVVIGRQKRPLSGIEIALYWLGCAVIGAAVLFSLADGYEWNVFDIYHPHEDTALLLAATTAVVSGVIVAFWRRAALEHEEIAIYWGGSSFALEVAASALAHGMNWVPEVTAVATISVLASGAMLIGRRKAELGIVETVIYWLGLSVAGAMLIVFALTVLGVIRRDLPAALLLILLTVLVSGAVLWWRRRKRAKVAS